MDFTVIPNYHISSLPPISAAGLNSYIIAAYPEYLTLYSHNSHIQDFQIPAVHLIRMPNTKQIICGSQGFISIYNVEESKLVREISGHNKVKCIATHNNPALLITGGKDGFVKLWDLRRKEAVFSNKAHKFTVTSVDAKENAFATGGKEGSIKVGDLRKIGLETVCCSEKVTDLSISPGADRVAAIHSNSLVRIYNLSSFETISTTAVVKSLQIKYKPEGVYVLSPYKLTVLNTLGLIFEKEQKWSYPIHLSPNNRVLSRELGIDVWEIKLTTKTQGLDFNKLDKIEETVNIRMNLESRAISERSFVTINNEQNVNTEDITNGHNKTMFILEKRAKELDELLEFWELGGINKIFPRIMKSEFAIVAGILSVLFAPKQKTTFIGICNAKIFLDLCLKLAKSKNNYFGEISGKCAGAILRAISQDLCNTLATSLPVSKSDQQECISVFNSLISLLSALKSFKRGIPEVNELEFFIEKLSPRVSTIPPDPDDLSFIK